MNRSKTFQLLKIEKENENKDIKTKQKIVKTKANLGLTPPLGYAGSCIDNALDKIGGKQPLKYNAGGHKSLISWESSSSNQKSMDPFRESTDRYVKSIGIFPNHKPLSPYMAPTPGPKPRLGNKQIKRQSKVITIPELDKKLMHENRMDLCSTESQNDSSIVVEELKATKIVESSVKDDVVNVIVEPPQSESTENGAIKEACSDSDISFHSSKFEHDDAPVHPSDSCTYLDLDLCSLASSYHGNEAFYTAPLLSVPKNVHSACSTCRTPQPTSKPTKRNDIKLEKNAMKKERNSLLVTPKFTKSPLETELENAVNSERMVRAAFEKFDALPKRHVQYSNRKKDNSTPRNPKRVSTFCQTVDSSLVDRKRRTNMKVNEIPAVSDDTDIESVRLVRPHYEKHYAYFQKDSARLSPSKRFCSAGQARNESAVQNSVDKNELTARSTLIEYPSQIEMKLHISDISESEEKIKKSVYKSAKKQQVDVTFRNVKSLKKEILILRALGDRLEATMEHTASEPSTSPRKRKHALGSSNTIASLTKELKKIDSSINVFPGRRGDRSSRCQALPISVINKCPQRVCFLIFAKGVLHQLGVVEEFKIVPKTIDELRKDPSSNFYIPKDGKLECTSFEKLRAEPQILLENLKSKTDGLQFNFLDHDPIFFNSLLMPAFIAGNSEKTQLGLRSKCIRPPGDAIFSENEEKSLQQEVPKEIKAIFKSEGSTVRTNTAKISAKKDKKEIDRFRETFLSNEEKEPKRITPTVPVEPKKTKEIPNTVETKRKGSNPPSPVAPRRSRIRRNCTPMPMDAFDEPKNCLWKRLLIGIVQVSIFLGLIMALSLPDIKC